MYIDLHTSGYKHEGNSERHAGERGMEVRNQAMRRYALLPGVSVGSGVAMGVMGELGMGEGKGEGGVVWLKVPANKTEFIHQFLHTVQCGDKGLHCNHA